MNMTRRFILLGLCYLFATLACTTACGTDDGLPDSFPSASTTPTDSTATDSSALSTDSATTDSMDITPSDSTVADSVTDGTDVTPDEDDNQNNHTMTTDIIITVGATSFTATLDTTAAAQAFADLLPLTMSMAELNGNEKYCGLPQSLPTDSYRPGTIYAGDLMLWGSTTLVLFYETFSSSYSYTRLGRVDNPSGLADAVGSGQVTVTFALP